MVDTMIDGWNLVIGIEIHAQVKSNSKLFSSSPTDFGSNPNSQVSLINDYMVIFKIKEIMNLLESLFLLPLIK